MNAWIIALLLLAANIVLIVLDKRREDSCEDGAKSPELRKKLRKRVRDTWGNKALPVLLCAILALAIVGCATTGMHAVYVPDGVPVRLRETVRSVKVWVLDKNGKPVPAEMDLPEGWYCLPLPDGEQ